MSKPRETCTDCKVQLQTIRLVDATEMGMGGVGKKHVDLAYAAPEAQVSFFTHSIPPRGFVWGKICPQCGQILLYGEPT